MARLTHQNLDNATFLGVASETTSELQLKGWLDRSRTANLVERVETCIIAASEAVCQGLGGLTK